MNLNDLNLPFIYVSFHMLGVIFSRKFFCCLFQKEKWAVWFLKTKCKFKNCKLNANPCHDPVNM